MAEHGLPLLFNYIHDLMFTSLPSKMDTSFTFLKGLLPDLGLEISIKKLVPPSTSVTCLGILINSIQKTVSIPQEKLAESNNLYLQWATKTYCGKKHLQFFAWLLTIYFKMC